MILSTDGSVGEGIGFTECEEYCKVPSGKENY